MYGLRSSQRRQKDQHTSDKEKKTKSKIYETSITTFQSMQILGPKELASPIILLGQDESASKQAKLNDYGTESLLLQDRNTELESVKKQKARGFLRHGLG